MYKKAKDLIKDLSSYSRLLPKVLPLDLRGRSVDYSADEYKDVVRRTVERIHPRRMKLEVDEIIPRTDNTSTFRFKRIDGPLPPFRAGQYINIFVEVDGVVTSRPYSISSIPGSDRLELTVRLKPGGFVSHYFLRSVRKGDQFESTGPGGQFYYEGLTDGAELVYIAGGSGITPMRSMILDNLARKRPVKMHLIFGSRTPEDAIFHWEFQELAENNSSFSYTPVISEPAKGYTGRTGFIDAACITAAVGDPGSKMFYICGPQVMYDFCMSELAKLGVRAKRIRRELYGPPQDITREAAWPAEVDGAAKFQVTLGDKTFMAPAAEPLLNSMERARVVVPSLCRSGECSACRTRLLAGKVYQPEFHGLREWDRENGYIHPCMAFPISDLEIRI